MRRCLLATLRPFVRFAAAAVAVSARAADPARVGFVTAFVLAALAAGLRCEPASADEPRSAADEPWPTAVRGVVQRHCLGCHSGAKAEAGVDLAGVRAAADVRHEHELWPRVATVLTRRRMPPKDSPPPSEEERTVLLDWTRATVARQRTESAGDPGIVPLRRLTQVEYERTVAAVTGQPIAVVRDLPTDLVGREGFGNAAAMQTLTAGHLERYLRAAKKVAAHARVLPSRGLTWEDAPAVATANSQILRYVERIEAIPAPALRSSFKYEYREPGQFDLTRVLRVLWERERHPQEDFAAVCVREKVHRRHAEWIAGHLRDPGDSPWVRQLLVEPWKQLLADRSLSADDARRRCREIGDGATGVVRATLGLGRIVPTSEQHHLVGIGLKEAHWGTVRDALVRREGRTFLPWHVVLTDGGLADRGAAAARDSAAPRGVVLLKTTPRLAEAFLARHADTVERRRGPKGDELALAYPGAYSIEVELDAGHVADLALIDERGRIPDKTKHTLAELISGTFSTREVASGRCVQILSDVRPVRDGFGRPVTTAPAPGQVLPAPVDGAFGGQDPRYGQLAGLRAAAPSEAVAANVALLDELLDRFLPALYFEDRTVSEIGGSYRSRAERFGFGPEVKYERRPGADRWLKAVHLDEAQSRRLDDAWWDLWAAGQEPRHRREGLLGLHPAVAAAASGDGPRAEGAVVPAGDAGATDEADRLAARFAQVAAPGLATYGTWVRAVPHPAERWRATGRMIAEIERRQEGHALPGLLSFAARAWRRPLEGGEAEALAATYRENRARGAGIEEAVRTTLAAVLASPHFLFRVESAPEGTTSRAVETRALAVRLSYLLWSAPPDETLTARAEDGSLARDDVLLAEARRLIADRRIDAFVDDFFGQWFQFRNYDGLVETSTERYPEFTSHVKQLYIDQLRRQFQHLVQQDRPPTDLTTGTRIWISPHLARLYGLRLEEIDWPRDKSGSPPRLPKSDDELFVRDPKTGRPTDRPAFDELHLADLSRTDRRGLWGLGAMLTMSSKPLRTDPIRRAHWVYTALLGRRVPDPPADAGQLPDEDRLGDGMSVRQRLVEHRRRAGCVSCHSRFDHFGFALERFDAVGRPREKDAEGLPIDDRFAEDGTEYVGPRGLAEYLAKHEDEFLRCLCRKLIAYALGRDPLPGDEPLVDRMLAGGARDGRFSGFLEPLLLSTQFRHRHGRDRDLVGSE